MGHYPGADWDEARGSAENTRTSGDAARPESADGAAELTRPATRQLPRLSEVQYRALSYCLANSSPDEKGEPPWLELAGLGLGRATIRALQRFGLIEARGEGYPGQLVGQRYRITDAGRLAIERGPAG